MNIVVIGAGLAAASAAQELREHGSPDTITVIGAEPHLPYERPPLSKGVLLGKDEPYPSSFTTASGTTTTRSNYASAPRSLKSISTASTCTSAWSRSPMTGCS